MKNVFSKLKNVLRRTRKAYDDTSNVSEKQTLSKSGSPCCDTLVHIAYRGVSDGRLYLVHDKKWQDVKFFRPTGLRVYCQKCRQRIL